MKEELEKLVSEIEEKIDPEFNPDLEYWENGNHDDSYSYGVETGEQSVYKNILEKLKQILSK
jgi:hypothetical protein